MNYNYKLSLITQITDYSEKQKITTIIEKPHPINIINLSDELVHHCLKPTRQLTSNGNDDTITEILLQ